LARCFRILEDRAHPDLRREVEGDVKRAHVKEDPGDVLRALHAHMVECEPLTLREPQSYTTREVVEGVDLRPGFEEPGAQG
jgi:hypothetical protein